MNSVPGCSLEADDGRAGKNVERKGPLTSFETYFVRGPVTCRAGTCSEWRWLFRVT